MMNDIQIDKTVSAILQQVNTYIKQYLGADYSVSIVDSESEMTDSWVAEYHSGSVFDRDIEISFNKNTWVKCANEEEFTYQECLEDLSVTIWHEVGHAIYELLIDYDDNGAFDDEQESNIVNIIQSLDSNEENVVEEFGIYMAGYGDESSLARAIDEYDRMYNN